MKRLIEVVLALVTLLSLFYLFPRISVSPDKPIPMSSKLQTTFLISNDGYVPIYALHYQTNILHLESADGRLQIHTGTNIFIRMSRPPIDRLLPNEKTSILAPLPVSFQGDVARAELEVVLKYKPLLWPFWKHDSYYFVAVKDNQGVWLWVQKAIAEMR